MAGTLEPSLRPGISSNRLRSLIRRPSFCIGEALLHCRKRPSDRRHIFVVGPPRSGTTLVQHILLAHPAVTGPEPETRFFFRWNISDLPWPDLEAAAIGIARSGARNTIEYFDRIATEYCRNFGAERFLEKTPEHALRMDFIRRYFPRSYVVCAVRDPRDAYLSAQRNVAMKAKHIDDYIFLWERCARVIDRWCTDAMVHVVKYEDLCSDPQGLVSRLLETVGLPAAPAILRERSRAGSSVATQRGHERLAESIAGLTVGSWREALPKNELEKFQRVEDLLIRFGYE
ncbi:sulfotransferase [Geminicoccaceae bacterium 1502E]|nr:sulfotransferase [Geminicoccaceae bacterium 1502E]